MRREGGSSRRGRRAVVPAACVLATLALAAPASAGVDAGAAEADITPPIGTPMFAYSARSTILDPTVGLDLLMQLVADPDRHLYAKSFAPSRGIHIRIKARALVLRSDEGPGRKVALVQADLGGLPYSLTQEVARRVRGTGIGEGDLLLSATHTHSSTGPLWSVDHLGYGLIGGDLFDARVFALTAEGIARAIIAADARLRPARVGIGQTEVRDASRNRAFEAFLRDPEAPKDPVAARAVSIDPTLTVVRVDGRDGTPIGLWSNFAVHPTSFGDENLFFSGDNAGIAARIAGRQIARLAGLPRGAEVIDVWTNAAEGDISPNGGADRLDGQPVQYAPNAYAGAHLAGKRTAHGIVRAWRAAGADLREDVRIDAVRGFASLDGRTAEGEAVGPLAVLGVGGVVGPDGFCAPVDGLAGPGQGPKFPAVVDPSMALSRLPVSVVRVGRLAIAAFPNEITHRMGLRIRERVVEATGGQAASAVIAGLTNAYASYTSTPEEYGACHYEGSFTLFGRQQGPRLRDYAAALAANLYGRGAPPPSGPEPPQLGFAVADPGPIRTTPDAGSVVAQPEQRVRRLGRATFSWVGGDTAIDPPRGEPFVELQRRVAGEWLRAGTEDGFADVTERSSEGIWTETWQFDVCDPLGTYRFVVRGRADRGSGEPGPYEAVSQSFELLPTGPLALGAVTVANGVARLRATYPDPGEDALFATPRLVRRGGVVLEATRRGRTRRVAARVGGDGGQFVARVGRGATARALAIADRCGNSG